MNYRHFVNRTTVAGSRLECDTPGRILRQLIEPISKSTYNAENFNFSRSGKSHLKRYVALYFEPPRLFGISGIGLGQQH